MSTHTEDTKEMTVENLLKDIDYWKSQERNGHSFEEMNKAVEALKECVRTTLTLYASQVREERDREILAELDRLDGDTTEPIPSRMHGWYYGYADCLVEVGEFITTLTPKT